MTSISGSRQRAAPLMVNCLGADTGQLAGQTTSAQTLIVAENSQCDAFTPEAPTIGLPDSFQRVSEKLLAHVVEGAGTAVAH